MNFGRVELQGLWDDIDLLMETGAVVGDEVTITLNIEVVQQARPPMQRRAGLSVSSSPGPAFAYHGPLGLMGRVVRHQAITELRRRCVPSHR
jgi:hypothetical protein